MVNYEALNYLVGLGKNTKREIEVNGKLYTNDSFGIVEEPRANSLGISTLTGLVDYVKAGLDGQERTKGNLIIKVDNPGRVTLRSELNNQKRRETYIDCEALTPIIHFDTFLSVEKFNIMLQSSFIDNEDRKVLLKVTGNIKEEVVKNVGDDGVSQSVVMKTGVATVGEVIPPNKVLLAPYRTFAEIDQPVSEFIFRMREGVEVALYEADGGAWRNEAILRIKKYLEEELKGVENVHIIA